jgi:LPXTG-motif cell wall-anchored protein
VATTPATATMTATATKAAGQLPNTGADSNVLPLVLGAAALLIAGFTALVAVVGRRRSVS